MWRGHPHVIMTSGNRVERLERRVTELEATIDGLTGELLETTERVRELESRLDSNSGESADIDEAEPEDPLATGLPLEEPTNPHTDVMVDSEDTRADGGTPERNDVEEPADQESPSPTGTDQRNSKSADGTADSDKEADTDAPNDGNADDIIVA